MFQKLKDILLAGSSPDRTSDDIAYSNPAKRSAEWVRNLAYNGRYYDSPINIDINCMKRLQLPPLEWKNYTVEPKKLKINNTGNTLILSGKWYQERPHLTGGPLNSSYVFSQLHFHWGAHDAQGSEHTVDGKTYPLEMHVVHFKSAYLTQEHALKEKDGICVIGYFFKLQKNTNCDLQVLINALPLIQSPHKSIPLPTRTLNSFIKAFSNDYFMYWGSMTSSDCLHVLLWLFCREPIGISTEQLSYFRQLLDTKNEPLLHNFRLINTTSTEPQVFHVNPAKMNTRMIPERVNYRNVSLYEIGGSHRDYHTL